MTVSIHRDGNYTAVMAGTKEYHFSYDTLIAFGHAGHPLVVCENVWSTTTGKHLNMVDGGRKDRRESREDFLRLLRSFESESV